MRTTKLVIGIISIVLSALVFFLSCTAGVLDAALEENEDRTGSIGVVMALFMLIAGIISIAARKGTAGGFVAGAFFILVGVSGFSDVFLKGWSILCLIFAAILILGGILGNGKKEKQEPKDPQSNP